MPDFEYSIDKSEVLRYLGHRGQSLTPEIDRLIDHISEKCLESARPRYCFQIFPLETSPRGPVLVGTGVILLGEDIKKHLLGAKSVAVMAATLGFEAERAMMRLGQRSTTSEVIFNAACTALIEAVSDRCEGEIVELARQRGLVTSYRYSPGYGDFPLEQQPEILGVIEAGTRLGITLTDSMLMLPKKSVSALIGLYPKGAGVRRGGSSCETCENRENCEFRKEGYGCNG